MYSNLNLLFFLANMLKGVLPLFAIKAGVCIAVHELEFHAFPQCISCQDWKYETLGLPVAIPVPRGPEMWRRR